MPERKTPIIDRNEHEETGGVSVRKVGNYVWNPNSLGWERQTATAAAGDGAIIDGENTSIRASVSSLASSNPLNVSIVDGSGAQITTFGGGWENMVDTGNSTTTPLGSSGTFVGTGVDCIEYASVAVTLTSDKSSTTDGMKFQFSTDNTNWDDTYSFDFVGGTTRRFQFPVTARYFRVNFENTNSAQTYFRVQTILHKTDLLTSIHRMDADIKPDRSATLVKAGLIAQINGTGDFTPIQANAAGVLKVGGSVSLDAGTNNIGDVDVLTMPTVTVTSTNLDVRDLLFASDKVDVSGSSIFASQAGTWNVNVSNSSIYAIQSGTWAVTANAGTNLDTSGLALETGGNLATIAGKDFATQTTLAAINTKLVTGTDIGDVTINNASGAAAVNIQDGGNTITVDGTVNANATLAAETTKVIGTVNIAAAQTIATTNAGTFAVQQTTYSSSSVTQVSSSASSVQLLASTAGRRGAYFFNDSTSVAYIKLGTTAATNSYTVKMAAGSFYELPYPCYTGRIDCIWASANGVMAITEIT